MRYAACAVYILANLNRSVLYTGVTSDLVRRVAEHREHLDPRCFTSRYRVDRLVYLEPFQDMLAAIEREKQVKGWTRAKPDNFYTLTAKGHALLGLTKYDECLPFFDKALALNPGIEEAQVFKGMALYFLGRHDEAMAIEPFKVEFLQRFKHEIEKQKQQPEQGGSVQNS